jgi:hypothetical protein
LTRFDDSLFDLSGDDVTDSFNVVDSIDWKTERLLVLASGGLSELVEGVVKSDNVDSGSILGFDGGSSPPRHSFRLGEEIVSLPSGDWEDWDGGHDEVLSPSDTDEDISDFITDFVVTSFRVFSKIRIHLVDTDDQLLNS